jgi:putative ABC transport system permease protein
MSADSLSLLRDLKYSLRSLAKSPGLTIAIVVSISLGIAANTTVFSLTNTLLFGSLPVKEPGRLVNIDGSASRSWIEYNELREQSDTFEGLTARFVLLPASVGGGEPARIWGQTTTANYFDVLGLDLARGRGFLPEEGEIGNPVQVVVISDSLWRRRFGADESLLGTDIVLNNRNFTVVGVTPPGFNGEDRGFVCEFWVPLSNADIMMPDFGDKAERYEKRGSRWLALTGRLKPRISVNEAEAEVNVILDRNDEEKKEKRNRSAVELFPAGGLPGAANSFVLGLTVVLMLVVGLVLLIACANVANILLARATGRQKEIGVRLALGASRARLIRQLLTESVFLSALGAIAGVGLSYLATHALSNFRLPIPLPFSLDFTPDLRVLLFTAALSIATGIIFGLAPALRATNPDLVSVLKDQTAGFANIRRFGLRNGLVVVQVTLSVVLLVSAGLFLRSLQNASSIDLGMEPDNVLIMGFDPRLHSYTPERTRQFVGQLSQRVATLPGIRSVSFVDIVPLSIGSRSSSFSADAPTEDREKKTSADMFTVSASYLDTMGIQLLHGRDFGQGTDLTRDVAIIDKSFAEQLFAGENPLGRKIFGYRGKQFEIIGVTADAKATTLGEDETHTMFVYLERNPGAGGELFGYSLVAKTHGDPNNLIQSIREEFRALDPTMAVVNIETMREHVDSALLFPRVTAILLGVFGAVGLTLAMIGLYGVMSYTVRRQTREIGIRMALGAPAEAVLKGVVSRGMALVGIGAAVGLALAAAAGQLYSSYLYGISSTDLLTFAAVPAFLGLAAFISTAIPAGRASRISPSVALRNE